MYDGANDKNNPVDRWFEEQESSGKPAKKGAAYCLYRNLHTGGWSLRFKGKVIEHLSADQAVIFNGVVFPRVEQAGKKRAMAENQRNVHAYLCSHDPPTVVEHADYAREIIERMGFRRVSYAPFDDLGWHYVDHKTSFRIAEGAILLGGREVWVPTRYSGYRENPECPSFARKRLNRYFYVRDGRMNPDWIERLQVGDVVRIAPHDSAACNYTITALDKENDQVEYADRFDGKPKSSTWSAFLETLKKSWKAELAAFVRAGIERRKEKLAKAKKRGIKAQIEKAEQELARFKSAYGKEGLKKGTPPPDPKEIPDEEKSVLPKTKKTTTLNQKAHVPTPKKAATKGGNSEVGEIQQELDSEGWLRVNHVRVATYVEGENHGGFETHGYEKKGLSYYKNADGAFEVMHQESGLRLHTLSSEVDARMFAEQLLSKTIPAASALLGNNRLKKEQDIAKRFLEHLNSLRQTEATVKDVAEKAQESEYVEEIEDSDEEEAIELFPYLRMGQNILAWWEENKALIASGEYENLVSSGGDYRATLNALQQLAAMERKERMLGLSMDGDHFAYYKKLLTDVHKAEFKNLRVLEGLGKSWFPPKAGIMDFARTFIPMLFSGWADKMETQAALRDLANLRLPIEEIEPLLNASDHGNLPAWVYLYHVERIAQELGQPIHYGTKAADSTVDALGVLGSAVQLWKQFAGGSEKKA
ncbi:hypothetical protein L6R29_23065 [Myxococcota bacterium]|nr:hypothetical protein [Myxococcota bacterium]